MGNERKSVPYLRAKQIIDMRITEIDPVLAVDVGFVCGWRERASLAVDFPKNFQSGFCCSEAAVFLLFKFSHPSTGPPPLNVSVPK